MQCRVSTDSGGHGSRACHWEDPRENDPPSCRRLPGQSEGGRVRGTALKPGWLHTCIHTHTTHTCAQGVDMGAIVDPTQRKSIDTYVQQAKQDGAEVYQACACMPSHGCFYPPTLITKVEPVSVCVQEEVGEIISILCIRKVFLIRKDPPPPSISLLHSFLPFLDIWPCFDRPHLPHSQRGYCTSQQHTLWPWGKCLDGEHEPCP